MTHGLLRRITIIGGAALGLALLPLGGAGAWAGYLQATGNIHEVEPGVYRSKQLDGDQLETLLKDKGIRTVINLRGGTMDDAWYRDEVAAVASVSARLIDIPLIETIAPDQQQLARLLYVLQHAPTPFLIHCKAGADRSGLAAALYELVVAQKPASEAAGQLSFAYGHFPWLGSGTAAMDDAFWDYVNRSGGS